MTQAPTTTLNTGAKVPMVALGTYLSGSTDEECTAAVIKGLNMGYRHVDTAAYYKNEEAVGKGIRESGIPREEIFLTTKVWNDRHHEVEKAFDESLARLGLDYIDLYLMHWPCATVPGDNYKADDSIDYNETWKQLEALLESRKGKVRAIGVSNFSVKTLSDLLSHAKVVPAMNQVETHPYNQDKELMELCRKNGIVVSAYSPIGFGNTEMFRDKDITAIAEELGAPPVQVILSWNVQRGVVVLPKSAKEEHQRKNLEIVKLSDAQMERMSRIADDKTRHERFCTVYDEKTDTVFGWTYERLGWERPHNS